MKKVFAASLLAVFMFTVMPLNQAHAFTLNVTSDIHAGDKKTRDYSSDGWRNIVHPKKWDKYFGAFLKSNADLYLTVGDNVNNGEKGQSAGLQKMSKKAKRKVLFGYGNHDGSKNFKRYLAGALYYAYDKDGWRIVMLDTMNFDQTQQDWLKKQLDTDKKVLIAMHYPPFSQDLKTPANSVFLNIINGKDNVKYVLSGHYHVFQNEVREYDDYAGVKFIFVQALTLDGHEGNFLKLELK